MTSSNSMEFKFPTNESGQFISQEELINQQDAEKIKEISNLTKAMPDLITKNPDGEWLVSGLPVNDYLQLYEGNDNHDMWKRD